MMDVVASHSSSMAATSAKGRMARRTEGAETVEIKATIEAENVRKALKLLGLAPGKGELRLIYFFDTPRLDLFGSGTIVRARRVPGKSHDSTVKIRPVKPAQVPGKWLKDKGFKLEADAGETAIVRSASLSRPIGKRRIKDVAGGKEKLSALFDEEQELFLAEMCRVRYDLDRLATLGPISALWWKIEHAGLPVAMTAELWTREDRATMLEVSIRVPASQAAFASAGFLAFLAELGAERENAQQAKTRWALEFYAGRIGDKRNGKKARQEAKANAKAAKEAAQSAVRKKKPAAPRSASGKTKTASAATAPARKPSTKRVVRPRRTEPAPAAQSTPPAMPAVAPSSTRPPGAQPQLRPAPSAAPGSAIPTASRPARQRRLATKPKTAPVPSPAPATESD